MSYKSLALALWFEREMLPKESAGNAVLEDCGTVRKYRLTGGSGSVGVGFELL